MRELRTFELDEPGQPVSWRAGYGQTVCAAAGKLWVTVEGNPDDIWLEPGQELALPEGYPARETIKVLPVNAAEAVKNSDTDLKTFSGIFGTN